MRSRMRSRMSSPAPDSHTGFLLRGVCMHNLDPKSGANCGFCCVYIFPGVGTGASAGCEVTININYSQNSRKTAEKQPKSIARAHRIDHQSHPTRAATAACPQSSCSPRAFRWSRQRPAAAARPRHHQSSARDVGPLCPPSPGHCRFHIKWSLFSAKILQNAPVLGEKVVKQRPNNKKYAAAGAAVSLPMQ